MKGLLILLGLNFELLILIGAAVWIGLEANKRVPIDLNWLIITIPVAVVTSMHAIWRAWKLIKRDSE